MSTSRPRTDRRVLRVFAMPNLAMVAAALIAFLIGLSVSNSHIGAAVSALLAAAVGAAAWWVATRWSAPSSPEELFGMAPLGEIPHFDADHLGPAPVLNNPLSPAGQAYSETAAAIEAGTRGQVLLVATPSPGQGATTTAVNLAIASTQSGRRVVLIDGDLDTRKLSQLGGSGPEPGLTDLAAGRATLQGCTRLWHISDDLRMPVIPAGSRTPDPSAALSAIDIADAMDRVTEKADLVLIDSSPVLWQGQGDPLAAHADGTLLVVQERTAPETIAAARSRSEETGAPLAGYVVNRAGAVPARPPTPARAVRRFFAIAVLLVAGYAAWTAGSLWESWRGIERDTLDTVQARTQFPPVTSFEANLAGVDPILAESVLAGSAVEDQEFDAYLIVGSDEGGFRADVIILILIPPTGEPPMMVSLPRDLYLPNRCTQGFTRINANLIGCGDQINGPTLLALTIEDFTGIEIDHFALFDFDGFETIIDEIGGVEICVDYPVRDWRADLSLPAGCRDATGAQALAWVRSRNTEEYVNGRWRVMDGVSDLTRNDRQQSVVLAMFRQMRTFSSAEQLTRTVEGLSNTFTLDEGLGLGDAINLAWSLRGLDAASVQQVKLPIVDHVTETSAQVLLPEISFKEFIADIYPHVTTSETPLR